VNQICIHISCLFIVYLYIYWYTYVALLTTFVCSQDEEDNTVEHIQFTTKHEYTLMNFKSKIAKLQLLDPEPKMPTSFGKKYKVKQGDYVLVKADTIKNLQPRGTNSLFLMVEAEIMTEDWQPFQEDMSVDDLMAGDDFLLYYQRIDATTHACKVVPTQREKNKIGKKRNGKAEVEESTKKRRIIKKK
jgi:UDP-2,3-diacylglucosamine pyrophosphatase LpxH